MNNAILKKYLPENAILDDNASTPMFKVSNDEIIDVCLNLYRKHGLPLKSIVAFDDRQSTGFFKILYTFGISTFGQFISPYIEVKNDFPSLTPHIHEASLYERKIMTFFGLKALGHPDPRQFILHNENWPKDVFPLRKDFNLNTKVKEVKGDYEFHKVEGEGIYEIPVGPVHAGIIEPGHFRFSVAGEEIILLEPKLGYSHKGIEKLFEKSASFDDQIKLSERISGDSSFSHSLAFCLAVEELAMIKTSERVDLLRLIYAELERIACHIGDIGFIMQDTGFNFGGSNGARLREFIIRINEKLTGSRLLRGVNCIGGVRYDINENNQKHLIDSLDIFEKDYEEVVEVSENSSSLLNRLRDTGTVPLDVAVDHGGVGVPARALGVKIDARVDFPYSGYRICPLDVISTEQTGDVYARFYVRIKEVRTSISLIRNAVGVLRKLGKQKINEPQVTLKKNATGVSIVEGWRGDIVYVISTNSSGIIDRVAPRDPSFLNWSIAPYAGKGNMVPDFPLINKSFNLSYTGHDL